MAMRFLRMLSIALLAGGCAAGIDADVSSPELRITPDDPSNPGIVRFDVPTAWLLGHPGDDFPVTLRARIASRDLAARELDAVGYCPQGFTGPDAILFPDGDRSRSAFLVRCVRNGS